MTGLSSSIPEEFKVGMSSLTCPAPVRLELSNNRSMYSRDNPLFRKKKRQERCSAKEATRQRDEVDLWGDSLGLGDKVPDERRGAEEDGSEDEVGLGGDRVQGDGHDSDDREGAEPLVV